MTGRKLLFLPVASMAILMLIGLLVSRPLLLNWFTDYLKGELLRVLDSSVASIHRDKPALTIEEIDAYADQLPLVDEIHRISIIAADGEVMGDTGLSARLVAEMDDHSSRPEIAQALKDGQGFSTRYSSTLESDLIYVARQFELDESVFVIRVATPLLHANSLLADLEQLLIVLMGSALIIAAAVAIFMNRRLRVELEEGRAELENKVVERTKDIELLQRLATMLAACQSLDEAQKVAEDVVPRILGNLNGAVSLIRSSRNLMEIKLDWGGTWPASRVFAPDECWAMRKGKYHLAKDDLTVLPCAHMEGCGDAQTICIPLVAHGNTIGMLHLFLEDQTLTEEKLHMSFVVGEHVGLSLANLELQDSLREQAIRDPLTGLYNRRYMEDMIERELMRATRNEHPLTVVLLDLDHFKRVNDTFGHDAGDFVLKSTAAALKSTVRSVDTICRIGGEEMAILLPEVDRAGAVEVAEKLIQSVRDMHLDFHGRSLGQVTTSIGIASFPQDANDSASLLRMSDQALYAAKDGGRDTYREASSIAERAAG